jgi:hypothetical protein
MAANDFVSVTWLAGGNDKKEDKIAIQPDGGVVKDEEAWGFFVFGLFVSPWPWSCLLSEQHINIERERERKRERLYCVMGVGATCSD